MTTRESVNKLLENIESQLDNWWDEHNNCAEDFEYTQTIWGLSNHIDDIRKLIKIRCK